MNTGNTPNNSNNNLQCDNSHTKLSRSKLLQTFSQHAHINNSINLSSMHAKKHNIKTLCPYHDMLPIINTMEKTDSLTESTNNINCKWACSANPTKSECVKLLSKTNELYEHTFDVNNITIPFMKTIITHSNINANICIEINNSKQQNNGTITFHPYQNKILPASHTIAIKAISSSTFKRNLQPVADSARVTKILDNKACYIPIISEFGHIFLKIHSNIVKNRRKVEGTDSVLGVGFDCASIINWNKPRVYWMHQSVLVIKDKQTKNVIEKKHISNHDLRFSLLIPKQFNASIDMYMVGITHSKTYSINQTHACFDNTNNSNNTNIHNKDKQTNAFASSDDDDINTSLEATNTQTNNNDNNNNYSCDESNKIEFASGGFNRRSLRIALKTSLNESHLNASDDDDINTSLEATNSQTNNNSNNNNYTGIDVNSNLLKRQYSDINNDLNGGEVMNVCMERPKKRIKKTHHIEHNTNQKEETDVNIIDKHNKIKNVRIRNLFDNLRKKDSDKNKYIECLKMENVNMRKEGKILIDTVHKLRGENIVLRNTLMTIYAILNGQNDGNEINTGNMNNNLNEMIQNKQELNVNTMDVLDKQIDNMILMRHVMGLYVAAKLITS